jgi:DNA-binding CsgD family transcriptional regulator
VGVGPARDDVPDRLLDALKAAPVVPEWMLDAPHVHRSAELTPYELYALQLASHGLGAQETANTAGVSIHTMKDQLLTARRRLAAKTTVHAVAIALRNNLIA